MQIASRCGQRNSNETSIVLVSWIVFHDKSVVKTDAHKVGVPRKGNQKLIGVEIQIKCLYSGQDAFFFDYKKRLYQLSSMVSSQQFSKSHFLLIKLSKTIVLADSALSFNNFLNNSNALY